MSKDDIAPISVDEVDDILDALDSFGASVSRATSRGPAEPPAAVQRQEVDGCVILRPVFGRP